MSELISQAADFYSEPNDPAAAVSPGVLIQEAREASGVPVDVLAAALKVSVNRLIALESDQYAELPDMVFARALASSACRYLRIDSVEVLALMPKNHPNAFPVVSSDLNATFKDSTENRARNAFLRQLSRPVSVAVIFLLFGAVVLLYLPQRGNVPESVLTEPLQKFPAADLSEGFSLRQSNPESGDLETSAPHAPTTSVTGAVAATRPLDVQAGEVAAAGAVSMATDGVLEFRAREASWIQVRDATKTIVFERTLTKGASAFAAGILPLSVVIGRADATDVFVRGAPFVFTPVARENVARFEVK